MNRVGEEREGALKGNRERRFLLSEHHDQKHLRTERITSSASFQTHPEAKSGPELK